MADFYVSVTYFSRPSFPKSCKLIHNPNVIPRDVLLCNKTNARHIEGGMQYDPNLENAEYANCEPPVRHGLMKRAKQYDDLYLLFRTRYFRIDGSSRYLVTGFYKIKKEFNGRDIREAPIVYAETMHFVSISDCIDVTQIIQEWNAFRCCPTSNNQRWRQLLVDWTKQLKMKQNRIDEYIQELNYMKEIFRKNEFQEKKYPICEACKHYSSTDKSCPLTWRRKRYSIDPHPANFMKNLDEFYDSITFGDGKKIT